MESVCCYLLVVFLAESSPAFPADRFIVTYSRENLINECDSPGTEISEGVHSLGWVGQEEDIWWKIERDVGEY
jgi:hypothetical protein